MSSITRTAATTLGVARARTWFAAAPSERCGRDCDRRDLSQGLDPRLEHGSFSPSLRTLRKLAKGYDLSVAQLFEVRAARYELAR
jgi:transcriptional regulator with XRE-family HTH domain